MFIFQLNPPSAFVSDASRLSSQLLICFSVSGREEEKNCEGQGSEVFLKAVFSNLRYFICNITFTESIVNHLEGVLLNSISIGSSQAAIASIINTKDLPQESGHLSYLTGWT